MSGPGAFRPAVLGTGSAAVARDAVRAGSVDDLPASETGYGLFLCVPESAREALEILRGLSASPRHSAVLRVTRAPEDMDLPGVSVESDWLLEGLAALAKAAEAPMVAPCDVWSGLLVRAMEGMLLPLFVHNVNNLMVGVMGNLDLAALFTADADKCGEKLEGASQAMHSLSDFMSDLGGLSGSLPDGESPATWDDLGTVCTMGRLACGRSVSLDVAPATLPSGRIFEDGRGLGGRTLRLICSAIMAAALQTLGGCGSIGLSADTAEPSVRMQWKRGSAEQIRTGDSDSAVTALAAAMSALPPGRGALRIPSCGPGGGEALLLPGFGAS